MMERSGSVSDAQMEAAAAAAAAKFGGGGGGNRRASIGFDKTSRRRSSIVTYFSEQKWSLLGFDVLNRGTGRPANAMEKLWEFVCALANFWFQYYLVYGGGAVAFLNKLRVESHDISDSHKMLLMVMFVENQIQTSFRSWFIFRSSVFSGLFSSFVIFVAVRGSWFFILNVTAFRGNGMLSPTQLALLAIPVIFFQGLEIVADYQLSQFIKLKQEGKTPGGVQVMRTGLWSMSRHPNHLGFMYAWPPYAFLCSNNWKTTVFFVVLPHIWIFFQGIATNEGHMMRNYGQEYLQYMDEVPMLWPVWLDDVCYQSKINWIKKEA